MKFPLFFFLSSCFLQLLKQLRNFMHQFCVMVSKTDAFKKVLKKEKGHIPLQLQFLCRTLLYYYYLVSNASVFEKVWRWSFTVIWKHNYWRHWIRSPTCGLNDQTRQWWWSCCHMSSCRNVGQSLHSTCRESARIIGSISICPWKKHKKKTDIATTSTLNTNIHRLFTVFENHAKCRIWVFQFWHFHQF